jgi:hypothetical protein
MVRKVDVSVTAGGADVDIIDGAFTNTRLNVAGRAKIKKGLTNELPERNDILKAEINGKPVFNGLVKSTTRNGDGTVSITAYDEFFIMKRATVPTETANDLLKNILKRLFERYSIRHRIEISDERKIKTTLEFSGKTLDEIAFWATKWMDLFWYVDTETGEVVVTSDLPANERDLEYVLNPTVENNEIPYSKVVVYGESPTSEKGQGKQHLISKKRVKGVAGSGEPVFRYKSKAVRTQEHADRAAASILREFFMQTKLGSVTVVGRPDVGVFDLFNMPEQLGGRSHVVGGVKHILNNEEGYKTRIDVAADPREAPTEG